MFGFAKQNAMLAIYGTLCVSEKQMKFNQNRIRTERIFYNIWNLWWEWTSWNYSNS